MHGDVVDRDELRRRMAASAAALDEAEERENAALGPAERWRRFLALPRLASTLLAANDRRAAVQAARDERDAASLAAWKRLMEQRRSRGG